MKKTIALLLTMSMLVPTAFAAPTFNKGNNKYEDSIFENNINKNESQNTENDNQKQEAEDALTNELGKPDFEDDFAIATAEWDYGYDGYIEKGELNLRREHLGIVLTKDNLWENFIMEYDFYIKELSVDYPDGYWFGPILRGMDLMINKTGIQYNSSETGVQNGPKLVEPLEAGTQYSMKIETSEKDATIFMKKKSAVKYVKLGKIPLVQTIGQIGFKSYPACIAFDNLRVWGINNKSVKAKTRFLNVDIGKTAKSEFTEEKSGKLSYSIEDPTIATVSDDGTVTGVKVGTTTLTATNEKGEKSYMQIRSQKLLASLSLPVNERTLYEGDSINFVVTTNPVDTTDKNLVWTSSDENVIELVGTAGYNRGVMAKGTGTADVTVSNTDGTVKTKCTFTVVERPALEKGEMTFTMKGTSHEIPKDKFGVVEGGVLAALQHVRPRNIYKNHLDIIKRTVDDIGFNHCKIFMNGYDPQTGRMENPFQPYPEDDSCNYYVEDYINEMKELGVTGVWDSVADTYIRVTGDEPMKRMDDMVDVLKKIKKEFPDKQFYITCTPEAYAMHWHKVIPTIDSYVEMYKYFSNRIKTEVDPDAKIAVTVMGPSLYRGILSDPNNWGRWEGDLEYTQGTRAVTWHTTLAKDQSWFDAIDLHVYHGADTEVNTTAKDIMYQATRRINYDATTGLNEISRLFPDKEIWSTEWNDFSFAWSHGGEVEYRNRSDYQSTVGSAATVMMELCEHMTRDNMTITSFYHILDSSGFGMLECDVNSPDYDWSKVVKLPYYYTMKRAGEIFGKKSSNTHAYPLTISQGKIIEDKKPLNNDKADINLTEVFGYGFGDSENMKDVIFVNPYDKEMTVKLDKSELKKNWEYVPKEARKPYDNFYCDLGVHGFDPMKAEDVTLPKEIKDANFAEKIIIPPYSIVTAEVKTKAEKADVPEELKGSLVLKVGSNKAILPDGFLRNIDPSDEGVKPQIVDGRTMVPLRIATEAFNAYTLWMGSERRIVVEARNYRLDMKIGSNELSRDTDEITKGDEEIFTLDVPPQIVNGRTMIPLRAVTETMGKNVFWDDATKLIVISDTKSEFSRDVLDGLSQIID